MIVVGGFVAAIFITVVIKLENKPAKSKPLITTKTAALAATTKGPIEGDTQQINPEQLLPESGDNALLLANKILEALPPPTPDCQKEVCVALTFDDGPNPDSSNKIMDALENNFAHATFFEIGNKVAGNSAILQRMQQDGDDIGNHSWSHPSFLKLTSDQITQQVDRTQQAIAEAGVPLPHLFRPPYGDFLLAMQKDIKLAVILWNVDPKDWAYTDPAKIAKSVEKQIKPGAIIVMHDKPATAAAMDKILKDLKPRYRFVTVTELLNLQPTTKGVYIGR